MKLALLLCLVSSGAFAKPWSSEFIRMELPEGWSCQREEIDFICQPDDLKSQSEAFVVVVVKSVNEEDDTLKKYEDFLKTPRDMVDLQGKEYTSKLRYIKRVNIGGREWVDALQLGTEYPGFYTRYLASINQKVAGLVTYSIGESVYAKYGEMLDKMVQSLKLEFDQKAYDKAMNASPSSLLPSGLFGNAATRTAVKDDVGGEVEEHPEPSSDLNATSLTIFLIAAGTILFFIYKKRG